MVIVKGSTASRSMTNGASVSSGMAVMCMRLKSLTIINEAAGALCAGFAGSGGIPPLELTP